MILSDPGGCGDPFDHRSRKKKFARNCSKILLCYSEMILSDPGGCGDPFDHRSRIFFFPKLLKNTFVLLRNDFK